jgi:hypothetical protein
MRESVPECSAAACLGHVLYALCIDQVTVRILVSLSTVLLPWITTLTYFVQTLWSFTAYFLSKNCLWFL